MVVGHLDHPLARSGSHDMSLARFHREPPAGQPLVPGLGLGLGPRLPRVALEGVVPQRRQLVHQLLAPLAAERRAHPDVVERSLVVVEAEQQRPHALAVLVPAEAADHAVGRAVVLHLEHGPLVLEVGAVDRLGHHAVEPGPSKRSNHSCGQRRVGRGRGEVDGGLAFAATFSSCARRSANGVRRRSSSPRARRSKATKEAGVSSASMRTRDSAGWMRCSSASKSSPEGWDDDLAVDHAPLGELRPHGVEQLGEVPGEGPLVAAAELDLVAVAEDDAAEAVPLRLVDEALLDGQLPGELGQHGGDRGDRRGGPRPYFSSRERRRSASTLPPVWQVGQ